MISCAISYAMSDVDLPSVATDSFGCTSRIVFNINRASFNLYNNDHMYLFDILD